ncbi:MAG: AAA family ATPase [Sulfuricella sp.]|nr:AAA family ATPase [Sulfuricella sp.]
MYFEHFGLTQPPFKIVPNHEFYYSGGSRADILDKLVYAVTCNDGLLIKIVGEPGTGKTMLAHMLEVNVPAEVEIYKVPSLALKKNEIPWVLADNMGLNLGKLSYDRAALVLQQHLVRKQRQGRKVLLFIDEAQALTSTVLEEVYRLSTAENEPFKLFQVAMFGQPELDALLNQPQLRNFRDQVTHCFSLKHLGKEESGDYLLFRMRTAGYRGPQVFSKSALKRIFSASKGSIRRINILADKALLAAFLDNTHLVNNVQVDVALRESWFEPAKVGPIPRVYLGLLLGSILLTVFLWLLKWQATAKPAPETPITPLSASRDASPPVLSKAGEKEGVVNAPASPPAQPTEIAALANGVSSVAASDVPAAPPPAAEIARQEKGDKVVKSSEDVLVPALVKNKPVAGHGAVGAGKKSPEKGPRPSTSLATTTALEASLQTSMEWLRKQDESQFTVQLAITPPEHALDEMQRIYSKSQLKPDQIAVYRTLADGKLMIGIVSGAYPSIREAREAVAHLPPSLLEYSPLLRTFKGIRKEINS